MEDPFANLEEAYRSYRRAVRYGFTSAILFTVYSIGQMSVVITGFRKEGLDGDIYTAVETACLVPAGAGIMCLAAAVRLDAKAASPYVVAFLCICVPSIVLPLVLLCVWSS